MGSIYKSQIISIWSFQFTTPPPPYTESTGKPTRYLLCLFLLLQKHSRKRFLSLFFFLENDANRFFTCCINLCLSFPEKTYEEDGEILEEYLKHSNAKRIFDHI